MMAWKARESRSPGELVEVSWRREFLTQGNWRIGDDAAVADLVCVGGSAGSPSAKIADSIAAKGESNVAAISVTDGFLAEEGSLKRERRANGLQPKEEDATVGKAGTTPSS